MRTRISLLTRKTRSNPRRAARPLSALLVAALALTFTATASSASADTSAQQSLAALNRIRSENGIPAGITLNDDWSAKCAAHDRYMQINDLLVHAEDPSKPGYSEGGNWAGTSSVLAGGGGWGPDSTPWDTAPIHFAQMLGPGLSETGIANVSGYSCLTTWPGYERTGSSDVIYTYPGDGRSDVYASEVAGELPFVPGQFVGLPAGTGTGPYLYVLPDGPWISHWNNQPRLTAASLTGPAGQVEVRMIDNTNPNIAGYLPRGSGMVIPVKPLRSNANYTATATLSGGGDTLSKTWSFKTLGLENNVSIDVEPQNNGSLSLIISSDAPNPTLTLTAGERELTAKLRKRSDGYLASLAGVAPAVYQACASSGGGDSGYQQAKVCEKVTVGIQARRYIKVSKLKVRNRVARVTVRTQKPFVGRRATVDLYVTCPFLGGGLCSGPGLHKAVRLRRAQTISLTVPRRVSRVSLELTIPAGKIGTLPYGSTVIKRKRSLR